MTDSVNVFSSLGIDAGKLIWQIVNFGILMFVLTKVLYKPILQKLDQRAKLIKDGLKAANENIQKQEEAEAQRQKMFQDARKDVETLIAKAKKDAISAKEEILEQTKIEASKLMDRKEKEIEDKMAAQEKALQAKVVDLSVSVARKALGDYLDSSKQKELIEQQLKQLAKTKLG